MKLHSQDNYYQRKKAATKQLSPLENKLKYDGSWQFMSGIAAVFGSYFSADAGDPRLAGLLTGVGVFLIYSGYMHLREYDRLVEQKMSTQTRPNEDPRDNKSKTE